eukprot:2893297-Alexandrium_andersonii.AAC.1
MEGDKGLIEVLDAELTAIPSPDNMSAKNTYVEAQKLYDRRMAHAEGKARQVKKLTRALKLARREEEEEE